jgi:oligopeptide transport system permease protein
MAVQERTIRLAAGRQRETNLWLDALQRLVRNKAAMLGGSIIIVLVLSAIFAPVVAPYNYREGDSADNYSIPPWLLPILPKGVVNYGTISTKFLLGADFLGRDLFSRLIYGTRISLSVGVTGALISLLLGLIWGSIAGYYGGRLDNIMMRIVDILYAFPTLLFIILLMAFFRSTTTAVQPGDWRYPFVVLDTSMGGMFFIFVGIGITAWMTMSRLVRGQILSLKEKEFIEAAHTIGARDLRIMFRHILPNIIGPCIVYETLTIPMYILYEAFLSFIGLGVNPPTPSWGMMINEGVEAMRSYPHVTIFPGLLLSITIFAFNFLGDGLRDALDPRMRGTT